MTRRTQLTEQLAPRPSVTRKRRRYVSRRHRQQAGATPKEITREAPQMLWRVFFVFLAVVLADAFVPQTGLLICLALAAYAWRGAKQTLEAFTLLALLLLLGNTYSSLGRWLVIFSCFGRLMWDTIMLNAPFPRVVRPLFLFSATIFSLSFLVSPIAFVSILKVVTLFMGVASIMTAFYRTQPLRSYWFSWFFTFAMFILLASLPLYGFEYGYRRTGTGFQGILSHPQSYGIITAIITAFITGLLLFKESKSKLVVLGTVLAWVGIFSSGARTALLATILALVLSVLVGSMIGPRWREVIGRSFSMGKVLFIVVALTGVVLVLGATVQDGVMSFLLKDDSDDSVVAALQDSRGALIDLSIQNFYAQPLTGIGFGVPSDPADLRIQTGPMGIPMGASTEKGFMPSAVLEETGIIGALLVLYLIVVLFSPVASRGGMMALWILMVCLTVNLGEMIFFAIGGAGTYLWLMMGFAHFFIDSRIAPRPVTGRNKRKKWHRGIKK